MGRYYYSANGDFDGKFWFGVQPSEDCEEVYGFSISEPDDNEEYEATYADAWQDDDKRVREALDKQFDIVNVPKDKRRYEFDSTTEIGSYVWDELSDYFLQDTPAKKGDTGYYMGADKPTKYAKGDDIALAMARVELGLCALNDIRKHGECNWTIDLM